MGSGFVVPLGKNFPTAKQEYLEGSMFLGAISSRCIGNYVKPSTIIFNMVAQDGIISKDNPKPIKYEALVECMAKVRNILRSSPSYGQQLDKIEFHIPKFGSLRAGGSFEFIRDLINEIWCDYAVYVYYL